VRRRQFITLLGGAAPKKHTVLAAPPPASGEALISFPYGKSIEVRKDRIHVLIGKSDLWHFLVLGNLAFGQLRLQLSWIKPGVDIAHWRGFVERALANGFDGVAATAFFLKNSLSSYF
jgi:hypothetical protein